MAWAAGLADVSLASANYLSPYNFVRGMLWEGTLTLWLHAMGLDVPRWEERGREAGSSIRT